jgi:hypothetical protein
MKTLRRFAVCATAFCALASLQATAQSRENRHLRIINRASSTIRYLYASNVDRGTWEEDILGPLQVIAPDHYIDANIDDGSGHCMYDLKAVLQDGRVATSRNVNVCTQDTWTVYEP